MAVCLVCGKENESFLCPECRKNVDIEKLCMDIINYTVGMGNNVLWDKIAMEYFNSSRFSDVIPEIASEMPSPRREYMQILGKKAKYISLVKRDRNWLYETYEKIKDQSGLNLDEMNRVRGLVMAAYVGDYRYQDAEDMSLVLSQYDELPWECYYILGDFYTKTRRYDIAEDVLREGLSLYKDNNRAVQALNDNLIENESRRPPDGIKKEYMPSKNEQEKYAAFMAHLGMNVGYHKPEPEPIPRELYPPIEEVKEANFDSFVAFDLETTGFSSATDSIIEIGAIKVLNGKLVEKKEFQFQEFVYPYKKRIPNIVTEKTGITQEDVKDARKMWEVIPDFIEFTGDLTLMGYNSDKFDCKFLERAGRHSRVVIENKNFDVMKYAGKFAGELGLKTNKPSLADMAEILHIRNPQAHRALADAITTAKVYLKLKEIEK